MDAINDAKRPGRKPLTAGMASFATGVRLESETAGKLDEIAAAMHSTRTGVLRLAVDQFLEAYERGGLMLRPRPVVEAPAEGSPSNDFPLPCLEGGAPEAPKSGRLAGPPGS